MRGGTREILILLNYPRLRQTRRLRLRFWDYDELIPVQVYILCQPILGHFLKFPLQKGEFILQELRI